MFLYDIKVKVPSANDRTRLFELAEQNGYKVSRPLAESGTPATLTEYVFLTSSFGSIYCVSEKMYNRRSRWTKEMSFDDVMAGFDLKITKIEYNDPSLLDVWPNQCLARIHINHKPIAIVCIAGSDSYACTTNDYINGNHVRSFINHSLKFNDIEWLRQNGIQTDDVDWNEYKYDVSSFSHPKNWQNQHRHIAQ